MLSGLVVCVLVLSLRSERRWDLVDGRKVLARVAKDSRSFISTNLSKELALGAGIAEARRDSIY